MKRRVPELARIGVVLIAIAMVWGGLWYLTMPIYPRFWQLKTLPVYGFVLFVAFGFFSLPLYGFGNKSAGRILHTLYWLPIILGILAATIWGLAATPGD
jgi:hypothetical protein